MGIYFIFRDQVFYFQKCLNKQATVDDDPTGIRWINNDLIGLKLKNEDYKKAETT